MFNRRRRGPFNLIFAIRSLTSYLESLREADGPLAIGIASFREDLNAIEFHTEIQERVAGWLRAVLDKTAKVIIAPKPPRYGEIVDPVLPKIWQSIGNDRCMQVAANLFAADVLLAEYAVRGALSVGDEARAVMETDIGRRLDGQPFEWQMDFALTHLLAADDFIAAGGDEKEAAALCVAAFLALKKCRRKAPQRIDRDMLQPIKEEVQAKMSGGADVRVRVGILLRLFAEAKLHMRIIHLDAAARTRIVPRDRRHCL